MNSAQQVVKGIAIALATLIILMIGAATLSALWMLGFVVDDHSNNSGMEPVPGQGLEIREDTELLEIDLDASHLYFRRGDELKIETNNESIESTWRDNCFYVKDRDNGWWASRDERIVIVYVPEAMEFRDVRIKVGAGSVEIEELVTGRLTLDLGAGKTVINKLVAKDYAKINSGAGVLEIKDGELKDLDFDMGAGKVVMRTKLSGENEIDAGVGKLELTLLGVEDDYRVEVDQGIGGMTQEGISLRNPNGKNLVKINGGVGAIVLRLEPAEAREN